MHPPDAGGQPYSIFGILDTIKSLKPEVHTYGLGACYSYASLMLVSVLMSQGIAQGIPFHPHVCAHIYADASSPTFLPTAIDLQFEAHLDAPQGLVLNQL